MIRLFCMAEFEIQERGNRMINEIIRSFAQRDDEYLTFLLFNADPVSRLRKSTGATPIESSFNFPLPVPLSVQNLASYNIRKKRKRHQANCHRSLTSKLLPSDKISSILLHFLI